MDNARVTAWIDGYERAWRTAGTDGLGALFTDDATYLQGPYRTPVVGLPAIAAMWEAERDGPDEAFEMSHEVVAVDGDTAVARLRVRYDRSGSSRGAVTLPAPEWSPGGDEWQDLWVLRFDDRGRCRHFEEWPIAAPA